MIDYNHDLTQALNTSQTKSSKLLVQTNTQNDVVDDFRERLSLESDAVADLRHELRAYTSSERNVDNQLQSNDNSMYVDSGVKRGSSSGQERDLRQTPSRTDPPPDSLRNATPDTLSEWKVVTPAQEETAEWFQNPNVIIYHCFYRVLLSGEDWRHGGCCCVVIQNPNIVIYHCFYRCLL